MIKGLCICVLGGLILASGVNAQESQVTDSAEKTQIVLGDVDPLPFAPSVVEPGVVESSVVEPGVVESGVVEPAPYKSSQASGQQGNPFNRFVRTSAYDLSHAGGEMATFHDPRFAIGAWSMVLATAADMITTREAESRCPTCYEGGIVFHNGRPTIGGLLALNIPITMFEIGASHWLRRTRNPDSRFERHDWLIPVLAMDAGHGIAALFNSRLN